ncbi:MFS transporter [Microlunatus speluncae]|uniref:MFS transporter n=1 Tax=Microlunatus speluncae TaxID=2594267 RepID=UPI001C2D7CC6|nr:MFS transporter [Microlunatus speluncae]
MTQVRQGAVRDDAGQRAGQLWRQRMIMVIACAGTFLVILDATIVSVALPRIGTALSFSAGSLAWVINAYTLTFAGFLLLGGRLCDVIGLRRAYLIGLGLFIVARCAAGLATMPAVLLAVRAAQGLGGALLVPATLALLTSLADDLELRARVLGVWSAVGAAGASLGPVIGGPLTQWLGWPAVFWVTLPAGLAAFVVALRVLPPAGFVAHQRWWSRRPLLPLSIFRLRQVVGGNLIMLWLGLGFFASPVLLSLYLQHDLGFTPLQAGLGYLPVGAAMFVGAQLAGRLTVRFGPRVVTMISCAVGGLGFALAAILIAGRQPYLISVVLPGVLLGLGSAAAFTPITVAATGGIPAGQAGLAAGVLNAVRQTSSAVGLAVLSTLAAVAHSQAPAFAVAAGCLAVAALLAGLIMPGAHSPGR